ncbi:MAG: M23 family metallopeptidase [Spirochaetales bacterium]|nr:MAG: M23 family metallopeptidase [Spirochaetales bacterium]
MSLVARDGLTVVSASVFEVRMTPLVGLRCFMIGVDSTVRPGDFLLDFHDVDGNLLQSEQVNVPSRTFSRLEIPLSASLSNLRLRDDEEKTRETRVLTDLILSADPRAVYQFGPLEVPVSDARTTSAFGDRRTYRYADGQTAATVHVGVDLALPTGTPVLSPGAGVVRMARTRIVTGNTVVIEHLPGFFSLAYHLDSLAVEEGEIVRTRDLIGTVGMSGLATGPHLHWELRVAGVPVEPALDDSHSHLDNPE